MSAMLGRAANRSPVAWIVFLALFGVYGAAFIARTSFVLDGERFFVLFDDAMISMRYAKNLAAGHGLVWNPGERVEGFSNFLWTLYMAAMHLLPIPIAKLSLALQLTSLLFLIANLVVVRRVALRLSNSNSTAWVAAILTATYYPLNNWALQGMEVGLLAFWVSTCVLLMLREVQTQRTFLRLCLLLGAGTWIRTDAIVTALPILFFASLVGPGRWRRLGVGLGILGGFVALQTWFRSAYYGDVLPNPYFLKMSGFALSLRLERGFAVLLDFAGAMRGLFFLPLLLPLVRRDRPVLAVWAVFVAQAAYSVYVGGDAWEWSGGSNRFLSIVMPLFMILLCLLLRDLYRIVARRLAAPDAGSRRTALQALSTVAVLGIVVLLNFHESFRRSVDRWTLGERPLYVAENRHHVKLARHLDRHTSPQATLAVVWAGCVPYFTGRRCVDLLGKSDRTVARGAVRLEPEGERFPTLEPGHFKWNYDHSIGTLRPDVLVDTWYRMEFHPAWAAYYALDLGATGTVYVRDGSRQLQFAPAHLQASKLWWRGLALEQQGDMDAAITSMARAIETGPYNEMWRYKFGQMLLEHRSLQDVEAYYDSTAHHDPKPQTSCFFRGAALANAGRLDAAMEWFRKGLEIDPAHEMSHEMWGDVLAAQGRLPEAIQHYRQVLAIVPEHKGARLRLASALEKTGRADEARQERAAAESAIELTNAQRYARWGKFLLEMGRADAARAELERAVEADPDDRESRRLLQRARREAGAGTP